MSQTPPLPNDPDHNSRMDRFLNTVERIGDKLPEPALIFLYGMIIVWLCSAVLSQFHFDVIHPIKGHPIGINNLLTGEAMAKFLSTMVKNFTDFAPLGIILVAMLGVGVAEKSGFINTGLKKLLRQTPDKLLTPVLVVVAILSHVASNAGYVLVIPLGGIIFHAAGRHPLAGIVTAFAGVSGTYSACFVPTSTDPLLQAFTQSAAQTFDPDYKVNPLCNYFFTASSCVLLVLVIWFVTDKIVEPRLKWHAPIDHDIEKATDMRSYTSLESKAFKIACLALFAGLLLLAFFIFPKDSPMRSPDGDLTTLDAPLMESIVPLIFLIFVVPGIVYGLVAGTFEKAKDVISAMGETISKISSYMIMAFFCSQFLASFDDSNLGTLLALSSAGALKALNLSGQFTIVLMILLTATINVLISSASAKWAMIAPILVPMLMAVGIAPELAQAAYRVGDSATDTISPLMNFFPLMVVYCQRYVKDTGIGSLASLMVPYCIYMLLFWSVYLLIYWVLDLPLGIQGHYGYPPH
ncbi:AbgT family transporter [Endozoicomonas sp. 4G]|uniref:AbgT family transporter n=1 Tax=Endozoicomonas sp. 4G TaxID=2872754 RepID=UPI002078FAB3|nr:AbgT family transporter [Endozoicomonas sp. 4G]